MSDNKFCLSNDKYCMSDDKYYISDDYTILTDWLFCTEKYKPEVDNAGAFIFNDT